jgi:peptidyl-prolyl cis-trans isomerase D
LPVDLPQGYAIIAVSQIVPTHQGSFTEVRDLVQSDYLKAKAADAAKAEAAQLAAAVKQGKSLDQAAKALGLEVQSADFTRVGNVAGVPAHQFLAAFSTPVGQVLGPEQVGANWIVYAVSAHEEPSDSDFAAQSQSIEQELLNTAQDNAFDAFRRALEDQMEKQGKLSYNNDNLKEITNPSQS